ncbi:unnamed protein product [Adineta ricciae]|uniref:Protein kinase domain-containing protein n=1 Tax=Adineta ricciae TaxID=249248 RepID=A0A814N5K5_ADIRI|nr:unnamed protein product [Adineta ricciae]
MIDTDKLLLPLSDTKKNIVLLLNGCFNPIHNNHIRLLEIAREHLNTLDTYHIVGGYVCPTHDAAIQRKISSIHATWQNRLEMCRRAVRDSSWIMVDGWLVSQEKNIGAQQSKQHLKDFLCKSYPSIEIVSICGGDALPKLKVTFKKELVICINNRPIEEFDFDEWFHSPAVELFHHNIILVHDNQCSKYMSSTNIRRRISENRFDLLVDDLHPSVLDYHREQEITYRSADETVLWSELGGNDGVVLGRGRCATVYQKEYKNRQVAVKVIRERRQFANELKVLTLLANESSYHVNLIEIYGIGDQFCVMEKRDIDLLSYIEKNRMLKSQTITTTFPNSQWLSFIKQMLTGFVHLISLGILHRDIKTDNILLSNMVVKISDFSVSVNLNSMTKMPVRGSMRHYPPESIDDKQIYTEKSDVFMFGCLLYEIVHGGQRVWHEVDTSEVVKRRLTGEKPLFSVQCEPWYLDAVTHDCWAFNSDQRPTFEQLLQNTFVRNN